MAASGGDPPPILGRARCEGAATPGLRSKRRVDPPRPPLADRGPQQGPAPPLTSRDEAPRPPLASSPEQLPATPFCAEAPPDDEGVDPRELPELHAEHGFGAHLALQLGGEGTSLDQLLDALSIDNRTLSELFGAVTITDAALVYDRSAFRFQITLSLDEPITAELELELYLGSERGGFGGRLVIDRPDGPALALSLLADKRGDSTSLMARCEGSFDLLRELLPAVFPAFEAPEGELGVEVSDPLLVLAPGVEGAKTRAIVGGRTKVDAGFASLPLAGEALDGRLELELSLVYASGAFSAEEVEGLVELGAKLPIPEDGEELRGLQIALGVVLDGEINELVIGLGGGASEVEGQEPPSPEAPAEQQRERRPATPGKKIFWVKLNKSIGPVSLRRIGGGYFEGKVQLRIDAGFELAGLGFSMTGLGLAFRLTTKVDELDLQPYLDGLSLSFTRGAVMVAGAFLRRDAYEDALGRIVEFRFDGAVVVRTPALNLSALGSYARVRTPPSDAVVESLFLYAYVGAEAGIGNSIIKVTGLALGMGANQRVNVPPVNRVKDFSLVKVVMGGGPASEASPGEGGSELSFVDSLIESMAERDLSPSPGEFFGCLGLRFTLFETLDCFALLIVRYHDVLEFNLVGLAHLDLPRGSQDAAVQQICHAELQLVATVSLAGFLQIEARLSDESWVFSEDCKLSGGFALFAWWEGEHAGDFVLSLGGYHPAFKRPPHYPIVPRVRLRWVLSKELIIKGGVYLALTPACMMAGGRLEAAFETEGLKARFEAYFDVLISWRPVYFELAMGISISVEISFVASTLKLRLGVHLQLWGPELGGVCTVEIEPILSFDIPFGAEKAPPPPLTWPEFGRNFIDREDLDGAGEAIAADPGNRAPSGKWARPSHEGEVRPGPRVVSPRLVAGDASEAKRGEARAPEQPWVVRSDSLEIGVRTAVPVTRLTTGDCEELDPPSSRVGGSADLSIFEELKLAPGSEREVARARGAKVGIHPMKQALDSRLKVGLIREDAQGSSPVSLAAWTTQERRERVPRALWHGEDSEPRSEDALVEDCITGMDLLKPPLGEAHGDSATLDVNQLEARTREDRVVARKRRSEPRRASSPKAKVEGWGAWLLEVESEAS